MKYVFGWLQETIAEVALSTKAGWPSQNKGYPKIIGFNTEIILYMYIYIL